MTDDKIIEEIRQGNLDKPINWLYRELPKIQALVRKSGGSKSDASEIFHDGLIILIEKVEQTEFELNSKLSTFLFGICRFLWMNKSRKTGKGHVEFTDHSEMQVPISDYDEEKEEKIQRMEKALALISPKCQDLINRFYFLKQSLQKIADELNASSVNSIKTQKYKCIERAILLTRKKVNS